MSFQFGKSAKFTKSNSEYIELGNYCDMCFTHPSTTSFTLSLWLNVDCQQNYFQGILTIQTAGGVNDMYVE